MHTHTLLLGLSYDPPPIATLDPTIDLIKSIVSLASYLPTYKAAVRNCHPPAVNWHLVQTGPCVSPSLRGTFGAFPKEAKTLHTRIARAHASAMMLASSVHSGIHGQLAVATADMRIFFALHTCR